MANQPAWLKGWNNGQAVITAHACCITYPAGATLADLMDTIEAAILPLGWSLHDGVAAANARCYKAPCLPDAVGAVAQKYLLLDYNLAGELLFSPYESWNAATHTGTNVAYLSRTSGYGQRIDLTNGGQLNIAISTRYLIALSRIAAGDGDATSQGPCGIVELTRVHAMDTVAANRVKFGFFSNRIADGTIQTNTVLGLCRTLNGTAGFAYNAVLTEYGAGGTIYSVSVPTHPAGIMPVGVDVLTGQPYASMLRVVGRMSSISTCEVLGTVLGLVALSRSTGARIGDDITLLIANDAQYGNEPTLDARNGEPQSWWVIGGVGSSAMRWAVRK